MRFTINQKKTLAPVYINFLFIAAGNRDFNRFFLNSLSYFCLCFVIMAIYYFLAALLAVRFIRGVPQNRFFTDHAFTQASQNYPATYKKPDRFFQKSNK